MTEETREQRGKWIQETQWREKKEEMRKDRKEARTEARREKKEVITKKKKVKLFHRSQPNDTEHTKKNNKKKRGKYTLIKDPREPLLTKPFTGA